MSSWIRDKRQLATALIALNCFFIGTPAEAQSSERRCTCEFAEPKWQAYGTKAACAVYMHNGRTACEVEFVGTAILTSKASPAAVQLTFASTANYLQLLSVGNKEALSDPKIFTPTLIALMRGAYFRSRDNPRAPTIDKIAITFIDKYAADISNVFLGKEPTIKTEFSGARFEVGRGYVIMDYEDDRVTALYFSPE